MSKYAASTSLTSRDLFLVYSLRGYKVSSQPELLEPSSYCSVSTCRVFLTVEIVFSRTGSSLVFLLYSLLEREVWQGTGVQISMPLMIPKAGKG